MGLFSKKSDTSTSSETGTSAEGKKPSMYQRYQNSKRGEISDEDLKKYLGKTKEEINEWAEYRPGVGKNQRAGGIAQGPASGLGGMAAADGYGGWGPSAEPTDKNRGLKFPPKKPEGKDIDAESKLED